MSRRAVRLLVVPTILFAVVAGAVFALAQWHPAKPEESVTAGTGVPANRAERGRVVFNQNCARCHGEGGRTGGVGPVLVGADVSLGEARSTIENGSGVMPAGLVSGQDLEDVLSYLETILGSTSG